MPVRLLRIVLFVDDLDRQTTYYRDVLGLAEKDIRQGWSEFTSGGHCVALHQGKGRRKPRFDFAAEGALEEVREALNRQGAKLGEIKPFGGKRICNGKDRDGNTIRIIESPVDDPATAGA